MPFAPHPGLYAPRTVRAPTPQPQPTRPITQRFHDLSDADIRLLARTLRPEAPSTATCPSSPQRTHHATVPTLIANLPPHLRHPPPRHPHLSRLLSRYPPLCSLHARLPPRLVRSIAGAVLRPLRSHVPLLLRRLAPAPPSAGTPADTPVGTHADLHAALRALDRRALPLLSRAEAPCPACRVVRVACCAPEELVLMAGVSRGMVCGEERAERSRRCAWFEAWVAGDVGGRIAEERLRGVRWLGWVLREVRVRGRMRGWVDGQGEGEASGGGARGWVVGGQADEVSRLDECEHSCDGAFGDEILPTTTIQGTDSPPVHMSSSVYSVDTGLVLRSPSSSYSIDAGPASVQTGYEGPSVSQWWPWFGSGVREECESLLQDDMDPTLNHTAVE